MRDKARCLIHRSSFIPHLSSVRAAAYDVCRAQRGEGFENRPVEFGLGVTRRRDATGRRLPDLVVVRNSFRSSWNGLNPVFDANLDQYTCVGKVVKHSASTKYSGWFAHDHKMLWSACGALRFIAAFPFAAEPLS
jgi:hypothetical protein